MSSNTQFIVTDDYATDYSKYTERVTVESKTTLSKVFLNKYHKKWFQNKKQLDYVVEYLVLDLGYVMDKEYNGMIVFKHPTEDSTYHLNTQELSGKFLEKKLVGTF